MLREDPVLWSPRPEDRVQFEQFREAYCPQQASYRDVYNWSVTDLEGFWKAVLSFTGIVYEGTPHPVLSSDTMWPAPIWFEGIRLNYAENLLKHPRDQLAILYRAKNTPDTRYTYGDLTSQVKALAHWMQKKNIGKGDVVAAVVPNSPQAVIAMLAATSLGAAWTSCSPEAGTQFITDRFFQAQPKLLVSVQSYFYDGKEIPLDEKLEELMAQLPDLQATIVVKTSPRDLVVSDRVFNFDDIASDSQSAPELTFERVPFSHPLFILYSSGTTGKPKPIVHCVGGTLLQHCKEHRLHCNFGSGDRLLYYTTTSWMMWNWLVSALASGVALGLFDGKPSPKTLWALVSEWDITAFGTSAPWINLSEKTRTSLPKGALPKLRLILSTGAPLLREQFDYIYTHIKSDVQLASISGGTDIISCFALGGPLDVKRGRIQCVGLGMKVEVWNEAGQAILGQEGELVCTKPFVAMPIYFLSDKDGTKYQNSYFEKFQIAWCQGDFAIMYDDLSIEILGRSDSTIKRMGVRIGTGDIYSALQPLEEIDDALVIGKQRKESEDMILFVKLKSMATESSELTRKIKKVLTSQSSWFKPDAIFFVNDIPRTANEKKSEILVKNMFNGRAILNLSAIQNPECIPEYESLAKSFSL